jgi:hypothetical protein
MDIALLGDEPKTGFITICCFLVFNFVFYYKRLTSYLGSVELTCSSSQSRETVPLNTVIF